MSSDKIKIGNVVFLKSWKFSDDYISELGKNGILFPIIDIVLQPSIDKIFGVIKLPNGVKILVDDDDIF